jgi:hypothetical protein
MRTVFSRLVNHLVSNRLTERGTGNDVAAIVDASPDARFAGFLGKCRKRRSIAREQVPDDGGRRGRKAAVRGRIAGMVRCWEQRLHIWVELEGADGPTSDLWLTPAL